MGPQQGISCKGSLRSAGKGLVFLPSDKELRLDWFVDVDMCFAHLYLIISFVHLKSFCFVLFCFCESRNRVKSMS